MRVSLTAALAVFACGSAIAGGPGGTWTCVDDKDAPALSFVIKRGGEYGHTYVASPIDGATAPTGSGDLDYGIAPDGGTSYVAVTGPLKDGGWWATHQGVTLYLYQGDADRHAFACKR